MNRIKFIARAAAVLALTSLLAGREAAAQRPSRAEGAFALIQADPDRAACNMHSYEFHPIVDTRAPKGFQAFYVSHYGRHGSRYETSGNFAKAALSGLHKADSLNLLTPAGKTLLLQIQALSDEHVGMEGALSPRGGREHQMLARRMAGRFPSVFKQKDRKEVLAVASTSQRCIVSMANFLGALNAEADGLCFTATSAQRYMAYINPRINYSKEMFASLGKMFRPENTYDWSRFMNQLFVEGDRSQAVPDEYGFVRSVFQSAGLCQDLDFMGIDIFRTYFTAEELEKLWMSQNDAMYALWGNSVEIGDVVRDAAKPLLKDFVEKADAAVAQGSARCADLRFGHDTSALPLAALLGVDDTEGRRFAAGDAHNHWFSFWQVPMATNLQMIFYKNKKGEVIAKVLFNEKEVSLPGLTPRAGPYYDWPALRAHFLSLCE